MKKRYYLMKYTPTIFEKNKKVDPYERSTVQLLNIAVWDEEKYKLSSIIYNSKTQWTLKKDLASFTLKTPIF